MTDISRRTLTTGAAWAVPAIAVGAAAPAVAASGPVGFVGGAAVYYRHTTDTTSPVTVTSGSTVTCGYRPNTEGVTATFTSITATYWLMSPNFKFTKTTATPWSTLTYTPSVGTVVGDTGLTLYPYQTTYSGDASNATDCGPAYSFTSTTSETVNLKEKQDTMYQISATVNGTPTTNPRRHLPTL